jgi:branched-chain amino acid aminotransferase
MEKGEKIWFDGKLLNWEDAKVHVMSHALNYGTGVFEGIRVYQTPKGPAVFRLREHSKRLLDGCKVMGFDAVIDGKNYSVDDIMNAVKATIKANKKVDYIKPCVFLNGERAGLNPIDLPVSMFIACMYMGAYLGDAATEGAKVVISSWHRPDNLCSTTGAKVNGTYVTSVLAKREAVRLGAKEAVMLNSVGLVAECTGENIFVYRNGKIYTPPVSDCILEGITRDSIMTIARDLGYEVIESHITKTQLVTADEVWMTGTAAEVVPVTMIDGRAVGDGKIGKTTKKIHEKFHDVVTGKDPKYSKWLDYVN